MTASKTQIVQLPEHRIKQFRGPGVDSAVLRASTCGLVPDLQRTRNHCSHRAALRHTRVSVAPCASASICEQLGINAKKEILVLLLRGTDVMGKDRAVCVKGTGVTSPWS